MGMFTFLDQNCAEMKIKFSYTRNAPTFRKRVILNKTEPLFCVSFDSNLLVIFK